MNRRGLLGVLAVLLSLIAPLLLLVLLLAPMSCKRTSAAGDAGETEPLPIVVKDASEGLLLTWIDDKGDFHVEQKVSDVPLMGRDAVRVVDPTKEDGTHADRVFVADLRSTNPDGSYPVHAMTRADFDAMAETRRQKTGPTLASAAPVVGDGGDLELPPTARAPTGMPDPSGNVRPAVIVYGASWCGACHQAAAYLRKKGVAFVEKDVEEDANAAREMRAKLAKAGMHSGSIPVLDVRGKIIVGFSAPQVDDALGEAL